MFDVCKKIKISRVMNIDNALFSVFSFILIFGIVFLYLVRLCTRLIIACGDIVNNIHFILNEKNEPFPLVKVLFQVSASLFSLIILANGLDRRQFILSLIGLVFMILSYNCLVVSIVRWVRKYVENVSEFIASCRYEIQDSSREHSEWKDEQVQWLLLLDLLGDSITRKSFVVDKEICGKGQPLSPQNREKLETLGYQIDDIGKSQISLSNEDSLCPI